MERSRSGTRVAVRASSTRGLLEGGFGGEAALKTQPGQSHALFAGMEGLLYDGQLVVEGYQFVVRLRHLCHEAHLQSPLVFLWLLEQLGLAAFGAPPQFAPEVDLHERRART